MAYTKRMLLFGVTSHYLNVFWSPCATYDNSGIRINIKESYQSRPNTVEVESSDTFVLDFVNDAEEIQTAFQD